ncbi:hypothetical protein MauCBS54593_005229 [Microsporum audouinii]
MAMPLRPLHFLSREDGTLTALVAVDELPHYISIRGVPRTLNHSDTQGMTSLGTVKSRGQFYLLDNAIQHASKAIGDKSNNPGRLLMPGRGLDGFAQLSIAPQSSIADPSMAQNPEWAHIATGGTQLIKHNPGHRHGKGGQNGNASKKEYCSFWLRHGECCIFKHEMPTDKPTLDKLGLRDIPRWYRDKHGVKGLGGAGGRTRQEGNGRNWRAESHHHPVPTPAAHGNRTMTTEPEEERYKATPTPPQPPAMPGLPHGHPAIYNGIPVTAHLSPLGLPTPGGLSVNMAVNQPLEASKFTNRCDLISIDEFRKTPTPEHMAQGRVKSGLGNFAGHHLHGKVDLMDHSYPNGTGLSAVRTNGFNDLKGLDTVSHNNAMHSHSYGPSSMPIPGSNSLWTMGENEGDSWNLMPLTPFPPVVGTTSTNQPNGLGSQLKKKTQRSRRLYQRRQSIDGQEADEEKNLRVTTVTPINTAVPNPDLKNGVTGAISPCFSPHPQSGSYASSPCSPRSGATTGRYADNLDFRGNDNHKYASRGSPNSTESANTNGGTNYDLFDLGLSSPVTLSAKHI